MSKTPFLARLSGGTTVTTSVRRNVAHLSPAERQHFVDVIRQADLLAYADGVSYWDKQDQIHQGTHNHNGPSLVPWHRELCNRFEKLLQQVDPTSLCTTGTGRRTRARRTTGKVGRSTFSRAGCSAPRAGSWMGRWPPFTTEAPPRAAGKRPETPLHLRRPSSAIWSRERRDFLRHVGHPGGGRPSSS